MGEEIKDIVVCSPLKNCNGVESDHDLLVLDSKISHSDRFEWIKFSTRPITTKGKEKFGAGLLNADWSEFHEDGDPDILAERLESVLSNLVNDCFPEKTHKIKSSDDPWITEEIRDLITTRRRVYKKEKRSAYWKRIKKESSDLIKKEKRCFFDKFKMKAQEENNPSLYYKAIRMLKDKERPAPFDVTKLRPGLTDKEIAEDLADYFGCLLYTSPSPRDRQKSRMPSSA